MKEERIRQIAQDLGLQDDLNLPMLIQLIENEAAQEIFNGSTLKDIKENSDMWNFFYSICMSMSGIYLKSRDDCATFIRVSMNASVQAELLAAFNEQLTKRLCLPIERVEDCEQLAKIVADKTSLDEHYKQVLLKFSNDLAKSEVGYAATRKALLESESDAATFLASLKTAVSEIDRYKEENTSLTTSVTDLTKLVEQRCAEIASLEKERNEWRAGAKKMHRRAMEAEEELEEFQESKVKKPKSAKPVPERHDCKLNPIPVGTSGLPSLTESIDSISQNLDVLDFLNGQLTLMGEAPLSSREDCSSFVCRCIALVESNAKYCQELDIAVQHANGLARTVANMMHEHEVAVQEHSNEVQSFSKQIKLLEDREAPLFNEVKNLHINLEEIHKLSTPFWIP